MDGASYEDVPRDISCRIGRHLRSHEAGSRMLYTWAISLGSSIFTWLPFTASSYPHSPLQHHFSSDSNNITISFPKFKMRISIIIPLFIALSSAQTFPECTAEAARSDDCAAVINANACYNKFRWNAQTLTCIDGTDNKEKQKKVGNVLKRGTKFRWLTL